jgi:phage shock protein A
MRCRHRRRRSIREKEGFMWQRLTRVVRSFVGFFISVAEDPEMILQQNIRDMNDQVPRMNESIAMVKANVTLLEREETKYKNDMASLTARVKAAIQANRDDIAGTYAAQLEQTKSALARNQGQLSGARAAFDKAMAVKQAFMREKDRKTQEALSAIADYRRSQWQKKVADAMEQFEVAGISQTHDEMVRKIEETTAVNEARMDMAMSNVDQQKIKIDDEAEKLQASELVKQFKIEMGLASPQAAAPAGAEKTIAAKEPQRAS